MRTYALERDIERLQSRLTSVEEDYADAEKSLEAVRADLRAAEGRVEELEAKLLAAEKAREEAEERLALKRREYDIEVEVHAATKRERDIYIKGYEAAESRAAGLSRELLDAMQARDSYRASAELRVGMRREFEALLGVSDTTGDVAFAAGLARLRELCALEPAATEALAVAEKTLALFTTLDHVAPGWRGETCTVGGDDVNRAWYELEKSLALGPDGEGKEEGNG